nr:MAG TPA: hypothetical protein [Caudoviricetes sp.]
MTAFQQKPHFRPFWPVTFLRSPLSPPVSRRCATIVLYTFSFSKSRLFSRKMRKKFNN